MSSTGLQQFDAETVPPSISYARCDLCDPSVQSLGGRHVALALQGAALVEQLRRKAGAARQILDRGGREMQNR